MGPPTSKILTTRAPSDRGQTGGCDTSHGTNFIVVAYVAGNTDRSDRFSVRVHNQHATG